MKRNILLGTIFTLALLAQACLSPVQIERGGASFSDGAIGADLESSVRGYDPRVLEALKMRSETRGKEPSADRAVSILDSLNATSSYRFDSSRSKAESDLALIVGRLLRDPSEEVRFRSAELLGKIGGPPQEDVLITSSEKDPNPVVREMAAESLEHLGLGEEVWTE